MQVTTLLSRHDQALSKPAVTEEELQHLEKQIVDQGNAVKEAKAAAKADSSQDSKAQVCLLNSPAMHVGQYLPGVALGHDHLQRQLLQTGLS